jgi:hypothetical protein
LPSKKTALVAGLKNSKMGTLVVTSERIVFTDTKFAGGAAGGVLGVVIVVVIVDKLQKAHEARPDRRAAPAFPSGSRDGCPSRLPQNRTYAVRIRLLGTAGC